MEFQLLLLLLLLQWGVEWDQIQAGRVSGVIDI